MESDELVAAAETAARNARRLVTLTMIAVAVAIVVLVIDQSIKRAIISEAQATRNIFDQMRAHLKEVASEWQGAGPAGATAQPADGADDRVADPAGAPADSDKDAGGGKPARARGQVGTKRGPGGDG